MVFVLKVEIPWSCGGVVGGGFCLGGGLDSSGLVGVRPMCDGVQRVFGCGKPRALGCMVFGCVLARVCVRGFCGPCRRFSYAGFCNDGL